MKEYSKICQVTKPADAPTMAIFKFRGISLEEMAEFIEQCIPNQSDKVYFSSIEMEGGEIGSLIFIANNIVYGEKIWK